MVRSIATYVHLYGQQNFPRLSPLRALAVAFCSKRCVKPTMLTSFHEYAKTRVSVPWRQDLPLNSFVHIYKSILSPLLCFSYALFTINMWMGLSLQTVIFTEPFFFYFFASNKCHCSRICASGFRILILTLSYLTFFFLHLQTCATNKLYVPAKRKKIEKKKKRDKKWRDSTSCKKPSHY